MITLTVTTVPVSWSAIAPEIVLLSCACVLLTCAIFLPARLAHPVGAAVAAGAFAGAMVAPIAQWHDAPRTAFDDTLRIDAFGNGARLLIFAAGLLAVVVAWGMPHLADRAVEYHALLLAAGGRHVAAGGVEQPGDRVHRAGAVLDRALRAGGDRRRMRCPGLEGALKYLVVGSVGAAFLLYGSALVYGATGQFEFDLIATVDPPRRRPRRRAAAGHRDDHRRARVQGQLGAVPHVDAGRVRGSAHTGDRVHVGGHQDGGAGAGVPRAGGGLRRGLGRSGRTRSERSRSRRSRSETWRRCGRRT